MSETKIEVGQIWEVTTETFLTSGRTNKQLGERQIKLKRGEKIEIRYPFAWHFRTVDNKYFHADPETIYQNARLYGNIWPRVKSNNVAKLDEILRIQLYDRIPDLEALEL